MEVQVQSILRHSIKIYYYHWDYLREYDVEGLISLLQALCLHREAHLKVPSGDIGVPVESMRKKRKLDLM